MDSGAYAFWCAAKLINGVLKDEARRMAFDAVNEGISTGAMATQRGRENIFHDGGFSDGGIAIDK